MCFNNSMLTAAKVHSLIANECYRLHLRLYLEIGVLSLTSVKVFLSSILRNIVTLQNNCNTKLGIDLEPVHDWKNYHLGSNVKHCNFQRSKQC